MGPLHPSLHNFLGYLVCVVCNSKSFHSFLFKLCIVIVHILKMLTYYFVHISQFFFVWGGGGGARGGLELKHFSDQNAKMVSGLCNC